VSHKSPRITGPNVPRLCRVPQGNFQSLFTAVAGDCNSLSRRLLRLRRVGLLGIGLVLLGRVPAVATEQKWPTITDPEMVWAMPTDEKSQAHPLRLQGRVNYYDSQYGLFWIEREDHLSVYVRLSAKPPVMHSGQFVVIEGTITPNMGLSADEVTVRVIEENAPATVLETEGRINDLNAFSDRLVIADGFVDSQQVVDPSHVRLILIVENRPVVCWLKPDDPDHVPDWRNHFVRVTGLYSRRFDPSKTNAFIEIWMAGQAGLKVQGTLDESPRFGAPVTAINDLYRLAPGTEVRVRGVVRSHQVGTVLTLGDDTGQVEVRSIQTRHLLQGSGAEAIGRVGLDGSRWVIDKALYRPAAESGMAQHAARRVLTTVSEVKAVGNARAAQGLAVDLRGTVTWSQLESDFFYLQDLSGGVRVHYDRAKAGFFQFVKYLEVKGVTRAGRVSPTVELSDFADLGSMNYPPAKPITLEQALTGREDGGWVEMRGFVRSVVSEGDWRWIFVTTPSGDFVGHLQNPVTFAANPGSLIRVRGVCETQAGVDGLSASVMLRIPFLHDITVEEDAPADLYDLPLCHAADLDEISAGQGMLRARVTGTVLFAIAGQRIYMDDAGKGLLLLSRENLRLVPGDRIEAVGILGREGARTILREAVCRRIGAGAPPQPVVLPEARPLVPEDDYRLVRLHGMLMNLVRSAGHTRLTLYQGDTHFDVAFDHLAGADDLDLPVGAGLEVTGIYQLIFDDFHQPRTFALLARTPADMAVTTRPRFWTVRRSLLVAAMLGGCVLLGLAWIGALPRRVRQQTAQLRAQMEQQARLEAEVQRAARLESLGRLAGGIAHDYNNLLTVIMGNLSLMKLNPLVMGSEEEQVREIEKGTLRARELTRRLLTFSEGGEPMRTAVDLSAIVREAAARASDGVPGRCACEIAADLRPARVDPEQISQTLQVLMRNAVRAMPAPGAVRITLANADVQKGSHTLPPGAYLKITIADTGEAIPANELPRIFEPFFATKRSGDGLELPTAFSIIRKHQGYIEVQSVAGLGTVFTVWLPACVASGDVAPKAAAAAPAGPAPAPSPAPATRVLLMDDEESIRRIGSVVLRKLGLEPTAVPDGESALREFEAAQSAGRPFSLLILDLTIPNGIGGQATIEAIRKSGSNVPAIVCSGYSRDPVMANFSDYGFQAVVPKPYDIATLTETIKRLLPGIRTL
jgi:two-component system cell cycle sensor histidine kinase/response regulator CckA